VIDFGPELNWLASTAMAWLIFCIAEGSVLAAAVWLGLRFSGGKSSKTRFLILFSALIAIAALPVFSQGWRAGSSNFSGAKSAAAVTLPLAIAIYGVLIWGAVAFFGLLRVVFGLFQIRNMRRNCNECPAELLGEQLNKALEEFSAVRKTKVLLSQTATAPVAIGFLRPAVILPAWLAQEGPSEELKYAVLHELEHLRRRDDWTNLLQKIVRAVFFFHPAVWWLEREVSLERELACDDAVVERTGNSRAYASSLARLAERTFLRRQLAMAQALIGRVHQLTHRVSRMLDNSRPVGRVWKPAVPAVIGLALVSGASTSWTPELVRFADASQTAKVSVASVQRVVQQQVNSPAAAPKMIDARFIEHRPQQAKAPVAKQQRVVEHSQPATPYIAARFVQPKNPERMQAAHQNPRVPVSTPVAHNQPQQGSEYVLVVATEQTITAGPHGYQVSVTQLRMLVPKQQVQKTTPTKI
jgi:beta-lactamase regulating signal transducer with metallopeptidase domain